MRIGGGRGVTKSNQEKRNILNLTKRQKEKQKENFSKYNLTKREAKKRVTEAEPNAYESLYTKLNMKEGERDIDKLATRRREKQRLR